MQEQDDVTLLREFVERESGEAFAALVARHVNKVYSVALRHTGNPHQADEITQAVFVILARKSRHLGRRVILSGWLYQTARLTALTFIRGEIRRARREQEAHMQTALNENESAEWAQIAPLLDAAMAGLNETDRHAVVLRFFDGHSMREVGAALGGSESAAKMRINRALEKLHKFFSRHGIDSTTDTLAAVLLANSVQSAPVGLAKAISAGSFAQGAAAGGSTLSLAKATLLAMKTKTIVATVATAVVLGGGVYLVCQLKPGRPAAAPADSPAADFAPIKLANDSFMDPAAARALGSFAALMMGRGAPSGNDTSDKFLNELDPATRRDPNSDPAIHIKCLVTPVSAGSADYLNTLPSVFATGLAGSRHLIYMITNGSPLLGQHIRLSGWMKTADVQNWAGATLAVVNVAGRIFASDAMYDRPVQGTTDWRQIEFVTDIPREPCLIYLAPTLYGTGEIWCDDFQIEPSPPGTSITDNRKWVVWCQNPFDYSEAIDPSVTRRGHPAFRISYIAKENPPKYSFVWWGQTLTDPEQFRKYLGHTVRMSVSAKCEGIMGNSGLNFEPKGPNGVTLAKSSLSGKTQIRGTADWTQHSITCFIPPETQNFQTGFFIFGNGTLWIDTNSLILEIAD